MCLVSHHVASTLCNEILCAYFSLSNGFILVENLWGPAAIIVFLAHSRTLSPYSIFKTEVPFTLKHMTATPECGFRMGLVMQSCEYNWWSELGVQFNQHRGRK